MVQDAEDEPQAPNLAMSAGHVARQATGQMTVTVATNDEMTEDPIQETEGAEAIQEGPAADHPLPDTTVITEIDVVVADQVRVVPKNSVKVDASSVTRKATLSVTAQSWEEAVDAVAQWAAATMEVVTTTVTAQATTTTEGPHPEVDPLPDTSVETRTTWKGVWSMSHRAGTSQDHLTTVTATEWDKSNEDDQRFERLCLTVNLN